MNFVTRAIILYAKPYRMVDEKSGQVNEGITMQYYPADTMEDYFDEETHERGSKVLEDSISVTLLNEFITVPGVYELNCRFRALSDERGKTRARTKVQSIKYISGFSEIPIPPISTEAEESGKPPKK